METERRIAIFGLGFVGLPLALSFALRGCRVTGVDVDEKLVGNLNEGITHHLEAYRGTPIQEILKEQLQTGGFKATTDPGPALAACDNIIVTVGVPVTNGVPDPNPVRMAVTAIARGLRPRQLVLIRSTLTPGTTRRVLQPLLEASGLKAEEDFYLAYAAERIAEGRAFDEFENMPTVVSGVGPRSLQRAREVLGIVTQAELVEASSIEVGEAAKVLENIARDVDIALVNEFARFTKALGIDIFEVVKVANTHTRVNLLLPGPGVGGYCVPNALYYLLPRALEFNLNLRIFPTARQINDEAPVYVAGLVLKNLPVPPARAKVAIFGIAMKDYSNDDRLSPAHTVIKVLQTAGVEVKAFDPAVPTRYPFSAATLEEALRGVHGIVVLARQRDLDYQNLAFFRELMSNEGPFIVDTRHIYSRAAVEQAGFHLETL
ncbi:MAG: nucleotide sugar dehydrogenase [Bacillota bacterium]|nr:nucleotide sugar dehydrogenase [Bacillota bacterium]